MRSEAGGCRQPRRSHSRKRARRSPSPGGGDFFEVARPCVDYCGGVADNSTYAEESRSYARKYHQRCLAEYQRYRELVAAASTDGRLAEAKRLAARGDFVGMTRALERLPQDSPEANVLRAARATEIDKMKAYQTPTRRAPGSVRPLSAARGGRYRLGRSWSHDFCQRASSATSQGSSVRASSVIGPP
jgi:hypothetical protein